MSGFNSSFKALFIAAVAFGFSADLVEAGTVTGPPVAGFTTNDNTKDQTLTFASPSFSADLSTFAAFTGEVHSLLGDNGTPGQSDLEYQQNNGPDGIHGDIFLPYAMVGRAANGQNGTVVYKFVVESGYQTTGGTISAQMYFRHDPDTSHGDNAWIGVGTALAVAGDLGSMTNDASFTKVTMSDLFDGEFNTYTGTANLSVPVGVTEFYVAFSDTTSSGFSSARLAIGSLDVNATLAPVPEPASLVMLALGAGLAALRRRS